MNRSATPFETVFEEPSDLDSGSRGAQGLDSWTKRWPSSPAGGAPNQDWLPIAW